MKKNYIRFSAAFLFMFFQLNLFSSNVFAQSDEDSEIESLYDQSGEKKVSKARSNRKENKQSLINKTSTLAELSELEPLSDIAVMQRRFLPTAGRYELSTLLAIGTNNTYFNNLGVAVKGSYFFSTKHAVELQYYALSPSKKEISNKLEENGIRAFVASANSFMGASYKFTPVYGKTAWLNRKISAYDTYFVAGLGLTGTEEEDATTLHFGVGQNYAVNKSLAFTVDLSMNTYSATVTSETTNAKVTSTQSDIFLSFGASFYFPEATYR